MQQSYRALRGMQVHAVPDNEKAFDASGRKLPWAYEMSANVESRGLVEKGPFGRSQRRSRSGLSRSRSKTAEPRREEEKLRAEQLAAEEAVFGSLRKLNREDSRKEGLGEADNTAGGQAAGELEATEVILYGFGEDLQWAAIDFYERISAGEVLEDYDRQPAGRRYDVSRSLSRATSQRSLSKAALKKKNKYGGGNHWIKITFNSRAAAELACARAPHIIKGHLVYAEPYTGRGPGKDEAIPASNAGAQITDPVLPPSFSTNTLNASPTGSSTTATSATATAKSEDRHRHGSQQSSDTIDAPPTRPVFESRGSHTQSSDQHAKVSSGTSSFQQTGQQSLRRRQAMVDGATAAIVLPASAAMLPKQAKQSWSAWLGAGDVIGSTVPKREDGTFDWAVASLYWKFFNLLDIILGTDFCALRGD